MDLSINMEEKQVLFEERKGVAKVILNRPRQLNCLNHEMVYQILKAIQYYEKNPHIKLLILKGNGRAFCSGGDVKAVSTSSEQGHWSYGATYYRKLLTLSYIVSTYKKPVVSILDGIVMGGGAGLSMHTPFRIVTEKTIFAMPEGRLGNFPDCGASHFLSRLAGFFGEYLGLTGAYLDGTEMLACGLATHFVLSKDIGSMENALDRLTASGIVLLSNISKTISKFSHIADIKKDSAFTRMEVVNKCFSADTVEQILSSLEKEAEDNEEKWIIEAIKSMKSVSPTSLKLFLRLIREGRNQNLEKCLVSENRAFCHILRRTITSDFYKGSRARLMVKDGKPQMPVYTFNTLNL
ncbi:hypothetical protein M9H77_06280 [Catharanthus roseus]|uniref:Uncharacterized protein n=1 Tax=Catharanthus roseus TaxID=4058 RepID=A0ACC0BRT1_CATRO|nr:hypothetical protein M9H77_06280 [Catharanthus roseus]